MSNLRPARKKVFIFEDEESLAIMIKEFLDMGGYDARFAIHPREGLMIVDDFLPDIVITDIKMPDVDGYNVFKAMKRKFPSIPIIVITGEHKLEKLFNMEGVDAFLKKPFHLEDLGRKIAEIIKS
jgi:DNA-binding response OmpR family regulator